MGQGCWRVFAEGLLYFCDTGLAEPRDLRCVTTGYARGWVGPVGACLAAAPPGS